MPKRRDDWLAGRAAAKSVVAAALGEGASAERVLTAIEIAADPGGAPYARVAAEAGVLAGHPAGARLPVAVSITHAEGRAAAAAERCDVPGAPAIGIDLGLVEPRSPAFVETFFTEEEARCVRDAPPAERELRANLVWCAKEAVLKALGVGLTVDTRQLRCLPDGADADAGAWPLSPPDASWRPFAVRCSSSLLDRPRTLRGAWRTLPGFVLALARATVP
ncbi:MAG TPA: 4'-phosphopantetheinyl transferase superfamily protein [Anaeromyxobacteraceae bacterium]|nr:4'-phosphopantetheinyl transferase superfamily protein [Anaeromyxobacteraceae bacterium]